MDSVATDYWSKSVVEDRIREFQSLNREAEASLLDLRRRRTALRSSGRTHGEIGETLDEFEDEMAELRGDLVERRTAIAVARAHLDDLAERDAPVHRAVRIRVREADRVPTSMRCPCTRRP